MSTAPLSLTLHRLVERLARRNRVAHIYLTRDQTDEILAEAGQKRDGRCTRRPAIDRIDGVPVYPDREFGAVFYSDGEQTHFEFI